LTCSERWVNDWILVVCEHNCRGAIPDAATTPETSEEAANKGEAKVVDILAQTNLTADGNQKAVMYTDGEVCLVDTTTNTHVHLSRNAVVAFLTLMENILNALEEEGESDN
jgi:hypothetical protein